MVKKPIKVREEANLLDAMGLIIDNKISGVCVVDADDKLVGVLSELDCLRAILGATYNETGIGQAKDYMTKEVISAHPNDDIVAVAQDMLQRGQRRRPVVEDGKLVGQITCRQLLSAVKQFKR
jgi:CBS domain-containing protein